MQRFWNYANLATLKLNFTFWLLTTASDQKVGVWRMGIFIHSTPLPLSLHLLKGPEHVSRNGIRPMAPKPGDWEISSGASRLLSPTTWPAHLLCAILDLWLSHPRADGHYADWNKRGGEAGLGWPEGGALGGRDRGQVVNKQKQNGPRGSISVTASSSPSSGQLLQVAIRSRCWGCVVDGKGAEVVEPSFERLVFVSSCVPQSLNPRSDSSQGKICF